jgi:protein-tyrosine phosphatase
VAFSILTVCTGNVCRSPLAERLLRMRLPADPPFEIASAGVAALAGRPMDEGSASALREWGGEPAGHAARALTGAMVEEADLVLTADTEQRIRVVRETPGAFRRVFTLREFARLGNGLPPEAPPSSGLDLRVRVTQVAAQRGVVDPAAPGEDDIADPFRAPLDVARACAARIAAAVNDVAAVLGLTAAPLAGLNSPRSGG